MKEKMTSKRRAELRKEANGLEPLFQIGKGGISDAFTAQTEDALKAHELIKLKVLLESAPEKPKELAEKIAAATGSEVVQVIGGSMIFYKENPELRNKTAKKINVKKSGTGKGAKDFKKKYSTASKRYEDRENEQHRFSRRGAGRFYR